MAVWVVVGARLAGFVFVFLQDSGIGCVLSGQERVIGHHGIRRGAVVVWHHRVCRDMVVVAIVVAQRVMGDDQAFDIAFGIAEVGSSLSFRGVNVGVEMGVAMAMDVTVNVGSGSIEDTVRSGMVNGPTARRVAVVACIVHFGRVKTGSRVRVRVRVVMVRTSR
jgi:hypothetical protein